MFFLLISALDEEKVLEATQHCNDRETRSSWQSNFAVHYISDSVMRVGSDTFGDPIFQKSLQN